MLRWKLLTAAGVAIASTAVAAPAIAQSAPFIEVSAKNPKFKALYDSTIAFRNEQYQWHQVCEATCDNYVMADPRLTADISGA